MVAIKDLTRKRFGKLTVINRGQNIYGRIAWNCVCSCEDKNVVNVLSKSLINGSTKSCGCLHKFYLKEIHRKNLIGMVFGKLTVIKYSHSKNNKVYWLCECECTKKCIKASGDLLSNHTKSCGKCNLLINNRPDLIEEWDFDRNKDININLINTFSSKKVWWICHKCDNKWKTRIADRTMVNSGCPLCNNSKGENILLEILTNYDITFKKENRFSGCVDKRMLPFDFYLPDYNLCIEFQGKQHYEPHYLWGIDWFEKTKYHDQIKRDFCKSEGIRLLEIPYWEIKNIEAILVKELNLRPTPLE